MVVFTKSEFLGILDALIEKRPDVMREILVAFGGTENLREETEGIIMRSLTKAVYNVVEGMPSLSERSKIELVFSIILLQTIRLGGFKDAGELKAIFACLPASMEIDDSLTNLPRQIPELSEAIDMRCQKQAIQKELAGKLTFIYTETEINSLKEKLLELVTLHIITDEERMTRWLEENFKEQATKYRLLLGLFLHILFSKKFSSFPKWLSALNSLKRATIKVYPETCETSYVY